MTTLPTQIGGEISVKDSVELAALDINGLPIGTQVWNVEIGEFFKLTSMNRTTFDIETTDSYTSPTWSFANATFTGFEGCTFTVVLQAPNARFSRTFVIDTVPTTTTCTVLDPPSGATTGEMFGSAVLWADKLVADSVVSANGVVGMRWVKNAGGLGGTVPPTQMFVAPDGDDANTGLLGSPKKTIYAGLVAIQDAGGGTLEVADGCDVGGPVPGQGIRIRLDFLGFAGLPPVLDVPGFVRLASPMRIVGVGNQQGHIPFYNGPTMSAYTGGGDSPKNPPLWVVGWNGMPTLQIEGLKGVDSITGARIGVDYDRLADGSIKNVTVTNATRTGTTTVFTVSLANPLAVSRASRTSNVTTLTIPNPGLPWTPLKAAVPFVFTSGDVDFASGAYVVTSINSSIGSIPAQINWKISYADPGPDVAEKDVAASSVVTHGCAAGELFDLESTVPEFTSGQYYTESVSSDGLTITVADVWEHSGDANVDSPGTIQKQERYFSGTSNTQLTNCSFNILQQEEFRGIAGRSYDIGHTHAIYPVLDRCCWVGYVGDGNPAHPRDEMIMSAVFVYPGNGNGGGASLEFDRCTGISGSVYAKTGPDGGVGYIVGTRTLVETVYDDLQLPLLRVDGNPYTNVIAKRLLPADGDPNTPCVTTTGVPVTGVRVEECGGLVSGPCIGGDQAFSPAIWTTNTPNPWTRGHILTPWADGRITGKHPAAVRAMGPVMARYQNFVDPASSWAGAAGTTITPGGGALAPDGMPSDLIETTTLADIRICTDNTHGLGTIEEGGRFVFCGWVNASANEIRNTIVGIYSAAFDTVAIASGYAGTGWQFVSGYAIVGPVSGPGTEVAYLSLGAGASTSLYGLTLLYIPPSVDDNDFYEYMGTLKHQPIYLQPGDTGTMENQKFIAHGGLGTAKAYVEGVSAGQLTVVGSFSPKKYEPIYKADGTIKGWVELIDATINT